MTKKEIRKKYCDKRNYTSWNKYNVTEYSKWLENELIKTQKQGQLLPIDSVSKSLCEDCKQPLPEEMKHRCYDCYDAIYCPK